MFEPIFDNKSVVFTYEQFFRWLDTDYVIVRCPYCNASASMFIFLKGSSKDIYQCAKCARHGEVIWNAEDITLRR